MGFALPKEQPRKQETVKSAAAFADYIALGPKRSLRALADEYVRQGRYKSSTSAVRVLKQWSTENQWQTRLAESISAAMERKLEKAAELDADTFLDTSQKLNERVKATSPADSEVLVRIRESVRKPTAKGATNVNVHLDIQISQILDQIAEEDGLTDIERREFEADIKEYLAEAKS